MSRAIETDPVLETMIDAEVAEVIRSIETEGPFPPEFLDELRHVVRIAFRTHPTARHLLEQLRPRVAPDESGKEDVSVFKSTRAKKAEGR